jgi:hypothetical protein
MPMIDQVEVASYLPLYFILFGEMKKNDVQGVWKGADYR